MASIHGVDTIETQLKAAYNGYQPAIFFQQFLCPPQQKQHTNRMFQSFQPFYTQDVQYLQQNANHSPQPSSSQQNSDGRSSMFYSNSQQQFPSSHFQYSNPPSTSSSLSRISNLFYLNQTSSSSHHQQQSYPQVFYPSQQQQQHQQSQINQTNNQQQLFFKQFHQSNHYTNNSNVQQNPIGTPSMYQSNEHQQQPQQYYNNFEQFHNQYIRNLNPNQGYFPSGRENNQSTTTNLKHMSPFSQFQFGANQPITFERTTTQYG